MASQVLDSAAKQQLAVLPALGVWADWNDGSRNETWHTWDKNPFNQYLRRPTLVVPEQAAELVAADHIGSAERFESIGRFIGWGRQFSCP